jgi:tetratricopeptide (TPR) repeat protein
MKFRLLALAVLVGWTGVKVPWEIRLSKERERIVYGEGSVLSPKLRDSLGQGMTLAALGGFRGIVANFLWLGVNTAWEKKEWVRLRTKADLAVLLQPRVSFFWENAGWHLAYNASVDMEKFSPQGQGRRNVESMRWIKQGIDFYERGIRAIPEKSKLYEMLALLYQQRLEEHEKAAYYFELASQKKGAPVYLERFVGFSLEKAGKTPEAYEYWVKLWKSSDDHGPGPRRWNMIQERIRKYEKELNIPLDKRVFRD